ncbi:MAG: DEAD/DEAH box helicase [Candidatus Omnitrophica bacterium]|nr:DEAD/DEAH box helicase [Candidatus Omnitrophota bacterium]
MNKLNPVNTAVIAPSAGESADSFFKLGIAPGILEILMKIKFSVPTSIQKKAIPLALQGLDIIGIAQTGTGKTHAFAIPMVQRLAQDAGIGLVLAPTRELALQIDEAFHGIARSFKMRTACLIGGAPMREQIRALQAKPRVIIATPGRFIDLMEQKYIPAKEVRILVLDEADRMLDMGFWPQIQQILKVIPRERQTMLFSATIVPEVMTLASTHMKLPVSVEIARPGTTAEKVTQELFIVKKEEKLKLLEKVLAQYKGSVLMFCRTKHHVRNMTNAVRKMNHRAAEIHSDRSLSQRREALDGFKSGKYRVLVATDIAARGIDVTGIELVLNYDIPDDAENYVHRIGRTARAGHQGHAISFALPDQRSAVREIEKLIRAPLPVVKHPEFSSEQFEKPVTRSFYSGRRNFGRRR